VVLRYRFHLEERSLAPGTINVRMAAVRRLAYEAADSGLLSPELTVGIHRVKGVRKLGSRLGNWLTAGEASTLWQLPDRRTLTGKRNRAILAILLGCGLRRRELAELTLESLQRREERWAIVDLIGNGRHIRTVPMPNWAKETLDVWLTAAHVESGPLFSGGIGLGPEGPAPCIPCDHGARARSRNVSANEDAYGYRKEMDSRTSSGTPARSQPLPDSPGCCSCGRIQ